MSKQKKRFVPIRSNSKQAKKIIRSEMRSFYHPLEYGVRTSLQAMKKDADAYNNDRSPSVYQSPYQKGSGLVDAGSFAIYHSDQNKMLRKIYGNRVDSWSGNKIHGTYKHLIGREYADMLRESSSKRSKRK